MVSLQTLIIGPPGIFSFPECLRFLGRSTKEIVYKVYPDQVETLIKFGATFILLAVKQSPDNRIQIDLLNGEFENDIHEFVLDYVREWFDLDTDLRPFYQLAGKCPVLGQMINKYHGLRLITIPDLFESLSWAIIGQQINLSFAYTLKQRFIHNFGGHFSLENKIYYTYPDPEQVAGLTTEELTQLQFSRKKAEYVITVARVMSEKRITKPQLMRMTLTEARKELTKIYGVGNWTANYALLKSLGFKDAFPVEDVGLHNAIKNAMGWDRKPTIPQILEMAHSWEGWRGYATFYLWRSLLN